MHALIALKQSTWQQQLRECNAADKLRSHQFDQFPLNQVQGLTDDFLKAAASRWSLRRTGRVIAPFSVDCDQLLDHELGHLKQRADTQLGIVHAGVLACIHVLTTTNALAQLGSLIPNFQGGNSTWDEQFDEKVALYLQCLMLAHRTRPKLYSSQEALAAKQLLRTALAGPKPSTFPTISLNKLFGTLGPGVERSELLPDDFISTILDRARFKTTIGDELERLRAERKLYEAYTLVKALHPLLHQEQQHQQNRALALIQEFIPHYTFWAAWRPSRTRIELWKERVPSTHWSALRPVLDLEGPDVTGYQRRTIRQSPTYLLSGTPGFIHLSAELPVLERILELFDAAVSVGSNSIDLFIYLCITSGPPTPEALAQLASALEAARTCDAGDSTSKAAKDILAGLNAPPETRLSSVTQALVAMTRIPTLQSALSAQMDIKRTAIDTLSAAQSMFCDSLDSSTPHEALAHSIVTLAHAMLDATWLHSQWHSWYLDTLAQIPSHGEVEATFHTLRTHTSSSTREAIIDHLGTRLGNRTRRNTQSVLLPDPSLLLLIPQDPIWYSPIDPDRARFRDTLKTIPSISPTLATTCLQRSLAEDTAFIRALNSILITCSDTVCVNLANFFGPRTLHARFQVDEAWKTLLLHMMKQLPSGMPERVAATMDFTQQQEWEENLKRVFGSRHLDPHGGMGFTTKSRGVTRVKSTGGRQQQCLVSVP
ncbi:hypothetical protein B0T16DRAFT_462451 [Cercophora newfieldiana]|uniref:Uncharacterized protein n=1 Tax=Cercophora newfieldiana TaxID=92897 RepID=A0AA39XRC0_9PEZI|nr:hypothetical protein B0T16DRAFT_462451 [Cercophora newfieldiana]